MDARVGQASDGGWRLLEVALQDDTSSGWSSFVGIVTAIIGNILISFALNTQRYAHVRLEAECHDRRSRRTPTATPKADGVPSYGAVSRRDQDLGRSPDYVHDSFRSEDPVRSGGGGGGGGGSDDDDDDDDDDDKEAYGGRKSYLKSKIWWAGIIMMTVGEAGNFLAYGFAPASIVSPLGVVALVSNCLIAPLVLKEPFRPRDFWGVVVAVLGAITVVLSANHHEAKLDPDTLWNYYIKRPEFLAYVLITAVAIIGLMVASPRYGTHHLAIDIALVGLFGGYTAIATKGVAALLSSSLYKAFTFPIFYVLVLILVLSAIMQIRYLNKALQNFNATQVIPTQFVCFTLSVIIGSAVLYREFESETVGRVIEFIAGCLLTFFGVYLITSKHPGVGKDGDDDDGDDGDGDRAANAEHAEQAIRLVDEGGEASDRTPKAALSISNRTSPFPATPPRSPSPTEVPSIAVTPAESGIPIITPMLAPAPRTPISHSFSDLDNANTNTPFFTPATSHRPLITGLRTDSSPGDLETPARHLRTLSLPKPDSAATEAAAAAAAESDRPPLKFLRSPRDSIRGLLPGPLLGPLASSPLSGIVADSLRRGETAPVSVRKRLSRSTTLRHDLPSARAGGGGGAPSDEETGLLRRMTAEPDGGTDSQPQAHRLRAMSETLGSLMRRGVGGGGGADKSTPAADL